jgi:hypothetical protein
VVMVYGAKALFEVIIGTDNLMWLSRITNAQPPGRHCRDISCTMCLTVSNINRAFRLAVSFLSPLHSSPLHKVANCPFPK